LTIVRWSVIWFRSAERLPDTNVKLLLIGGIVGLAIGVGLTIFYISLAHFFAVNARSPKRPQMPTQASH